MKYYLQFLCLLFVFSCSKKDEELKLEKGISFELAKYRKQQISDVVYDLHFKIPKEKESPIPSKLKVYFTINDLKNDVFLDFNENESKLKSININDKTSLVNHIKEHIIIDKTKLYFAFMSG